MPCRVHVAGEGAERASVCEHGGGGVCVRGASPASQPAGDRGRWALREGCEGQGTLPSETRESEQGGSTGFLFLYYFIFPNFNLSFFSFW